MIDSAYCFLVTILKQNGRYGSSVQQRIVVGLRQMAVDISM